MSEINPNVPTTETPVTNVEISSGESAASFDELDQLMTAKKAAPKKEKVEVKKEPEVKKKTFKAKVADKELDLDEDAKFVHKVAGLDTEVTMKELLDNYSGKVPWDKKYSEVAKEKQQVSSAQRKLEESRSHIKSIFEEKDSNLKIIKLAKFAGKDPVQFRQEIFNDLMKQVETWNQMDEHQRKASDLEFQNLYLKNQADASAKALSDRDSLESLDKQVKSLISKNGIAIDDFVSRYDEVETLVKQGKLSDKELNKDYIVATLVKDRMWNKAEEALGSIQLDNKPKKLLELVDSAYEQGFGVEDIPDFVSELWGAGKAKALKEQVKKSRDEHFNGKTETPQETKKTINEPMLFEELF